MKKLLIIALISTICLSSFSQITEMKGVGMFKIGETKIESLDSLCQLLKLQKSKDINSYEKENQFKRLTVAYKYAQIIFDPAAKNFAASATWHPDTKRFILTRYEIKDVVLKEFTLTFYKGILAEIQFKGDLEKVQEIFEAKYGESTSRIKEEPKSFVYTYTGNTIEKTETTVETSWTNGSILAKNYLFNGYTDKGNPFTFQYFDISDTILSNELWVKENQAHKEYVTKMEDSSSEEKKKQYSEF